MPGTANDDPRTPHHYKGAGALQPFDVIRAFALNFFLGNAVKYICRAGRKGDALEDLEKARHYLDEEIKDRKARQAEQNQHAGLQITFPEIPDRISERGVNS